MRSQGSFAISDKKKFLKLNPYTGGVSFFPVNYVLSKTARVKFFFTRTESFLH